jgi:hypothetical protein
MPEAAVEPDGRVERAVLVHEQERELGLERLGVLRRREVAAKVLAGLASGTAAIGEGIAAAAAPPNHHAWAALPFAALAVAGDSLRRRWNASPASIDARWLRWSAYAATTVACVFVVMMMLAVRRESTPFVYENF